MIWRSILVSYLASTRFFLCPAVQDSVMLLDFETQPTSQFMHSHGDWGALPQSEPQKEGKAGEWRPYFSSSWGTRNDLFPKNWLMQWPEYSWAAPSKNKNKQGSKSTVADCLDLLPWTRGTGWCFSILTIALGPGRLSTRSKTVSWSPGVQGD